MRLVVCGVRGSIPVAGPEFVRYGGATSCVAVAHDGDDPRLVLDAGTGIRRLARELTDRPFRGTILLGHLHWDHVFGLPFFSAAEHPSSRVHVRVPDNGADAEEVLARAIAPPHFPLRPSQLRGQWSFSNITPGDHEIEDFSVRALDIPHPGGRTFGYRISDGTATIAYLSDHSPLTTGLGPDGVGDYHSAATALAAGVDLLIHDAQHLAAELPAKAFLGHSAVEYATGLGRHCSARRVLLFHHDPDRTDDELDAIAADYDAEVAAEGQVIEISPGPGSRAGDRIA